jgi:hypothetical protein
VALLDALEVSLSRQPDDCVSVAEDSVSISKSVDRSLAEALGSAVEETPGHEILDMDLVGGMRGEAGVLGEDVMPLISELREQILGYFRWR